MFKSKMIYDPTVTSKFGKQSNRRGLTVGITFHTPKYSKCEPDQWLASQFDEMRYPRPLDEETLERRFQSWYWHTRLCKPGKRHLNYTGYMYWTGPKRRYTFHYMGRDSIRKYQGAKWWQIFQVSKHSRYVRWFDNGPQNKPMEPLTARDVQLLDRHVRSFRASMESSRQQMKEYIRVRSADGKGA